MKICISIGGASGAIYAKRLLDKLSILSSSQNLHITYILSKNAKINWNLEIGDFNWDSYTFDRYDSTDFMAPMASGSSKFDVMIVCPCSMGFIGRVAAGVSNGLATRAADVMLKERRKLILVPRETPFNLIHLRNMTTLTEAGAIICPAIPSYYSGVETIEQAIDTVVDRVLDLSGVDIDTYRWGI